MKYKCKECEHEFEGLSFINKCEKCSSDNIYRKAKKSSNTIWIGLIILLIVLCLGVCNIFKGKPPEKNVSYSSVFHKISKGNEVNFSLVEENTQDTIEYDHKEHNWLKLEITQETRSYSVEDNIIYPCSKETIRYSWNNDDLMKSEKSYAYVDQSEFPEEFIISKKAVCPIEWQILSVSVPDGDCNLVVKTDHPDNQDTIISKLDRILDLEDPHVSNQNKTNKKEKDLQDILDKALTKIHNMRNDINYFTKGDSIVKISISGKKGPYRYKNKWKLEKGNNNINIWAISTNFKDTKEYIHNGIRFDTTCFTNIETDTINEETTVETTEKEETPTNYKSLNAKLKQEVISHYARILTDVVNNWEGVYEYSGDVT